MSTAPSNLSAAMYPPRHPLGLPPGSVRGLLGLMIGGLFYVLLLLPEGKEVPIPIFLYFLLGLILVFFMGHSHPAGERQHATPLGVPHALLKVLHILAFAGAIGWVYYAHPERLTTRLTPIVKVCVCVWFCTGRSTGALGDCLLQSVESWALTRTKRCKSFLFCFSGEAAAIVTGSDMR